MKKINLILGILFSLLLMVVLLITSVEAVAYWTPGYYEQEYTKYDVASDVKMEMDDLLDVTGEMMSYLRGKRDDLHIMTVVDGQAREFFNDREIAHMEDVRGLFLAAISLRRFCLLAMALCIAVMAAGKANFKNIIPRALCIGTGLFFLLSGGLAALISTDFSKYFVIFHHIFFRNDLWILNPDTDLLINVVPEPFFMDTAARIGLTFGGCAAFLFLGSLLCMFFQKRKIR